MQKKGAMRRSAYLRVVLLGLLTTPDVRSLDREQDFFLVVDDAVQEDAVEDCSEERAECLGDERRTGRELSVLVLRDFEVPQEKLCSRDTVCTR